MWSVLLPGFFPLMFQESAEDRRKREDAEKRRKLEMPTVKWSRGIKWKPELKIEAASYNAWVEERVLDASAVPGPVANPPALDIPGTRFYYAHAVLPPLGVLSTVLGNRRGKVFFDDEVIVPMVCERREHGRDRVWMSYTPMEVFSLRPGTRLARGRVIVAGLGMGHQLVDVSQRRGVKHVTLVEKDRALADWVLPRIWDRLGPVHVEIVIGDAFKLVPKMQADIALIDVFPSYGGNFFQHCKHIDRVWCWGSSEIGGSIWDSEW